MLLFATSFRNSVGMEVAGTWFDSESSVWRISTVPLRGFPTEQEAVSYYSRFCDHETGIPGRLRRDPEQIEHLRTVIAEGDLWRQKNLDLVKEVAAAVNAQRAAMQRLRDTMAKSEKAPSRR